MPHSILVAVCTYKRPADLSELLDSMVPAQTPLAKTAANPRMRMGLCFIPHGGVMANWTPKSEGALE